MDLQIPDENVAQWKAKYLIKNLKTMTGSGTSLVSLAIPTRAKLSDYVARLVKELGTAEQIKSRVNRLSVLSAITSTLSQLKMYNKTPANGLLVYCGIAMVNSKEKMVHISFEPHKPLNTSFYNCGDIFDLSPLEYLLKATETFGFVIMDGNGCLFATLQGNIKTILQKFSVELPNKHNKGGQSSVRFARLRVEKRDAYLKRCSELTTHHFITNNIPNITGIIFAGHASFKTDLGKIIDPRLKSIVKGLLDIAYGGDNGLNHAITQSATILQDVYFLQEKSVLKSLFDNIVQDTGRVAYGLKDVMSCLEARTVETLIVFENLKESLSQNLQETLETDDLLEWLVEHHRSQYACNIKIVSDTTQEGSQFVKGFGGVGALLRYVFDPNIEEINEVIKDKGVDTDSSDYEYIY